MNEVKKSYDDYMNPKVSEDKETASDLVARIQYICEHNQLEFNDWNKLDKMKRQIIKQKFVVSGKVLNSMRKTVLKYER